jgi:hypothetical protein
MVKMVNTKATYVNSRDRYLITGRECPSGYTSTDTKAVTDAACKALCPDINKDCPGQCICDTAFFRGVANRDGFDVRTPPPNPCSTCIIMLRHAL